MNHSIAPLLVLLATAYVPAVMGQNSECASGVPSTRSREDSWVEPHPLEVVSRVVAKGIPALCYTFQRGVTSQRLFLTAPRLSWPKTALFKGWRALRYPGAELAISLDSAGPWTRITLRTRLLCATAQRPPRTHPQDVDFDVFVLYGTHSEAQDAIWSSLSRSKVTLLARSCEPLREGDVKIDVCALIAEARPDDADAQRQYAFALARFYRASKAWQPLGRLFALEGEQQKTYDSIGRIMLETNQFDDARRLYERGVVLWPGDVGFRFRLARANLEQGRFQDAADGFLAVLGTDTASAASHYFAAVAFQGLDRADESQAHCSVATQQLKRSLPKQASDAQVWLGLAYCAAILGRDTEAVAYFARAQQVDFGQAREAKHVRFLVAKSFDRVGDQPPAPVPPEP